MIWVTGTACVSLLIATAMLGRLYRTAYRRGRAAGFMEGASAVMDDVERHAGLEIAAMVSRLAMEEMRRKESAN